MPDVNDTCAPEPTTQLSAPSVDASTPFIPMCESVPELGGLLVAPEWSGRIRAPLRP